MVPLFGELVRASVDFVTNIELRNENLLVVPLTRWFS